jgi:hypothetical protein
LISADDHGRIAPDDVKARVPRALHELFEDAVRQMAAASIENLAGRTFSV